MKRLIVGALAVIGAIAMLIVGGLTAIVVGGAMEADRCYGNR